MDHFGITMGLIGMMFLAIIGVYVWTYKVYKDTNHSLGEVYKTVNGHLQNTKTHVDPERPLVTQEVCNALHTALKEDVKEIKKDVKSLLAKT